ncbi:HU family DNA-binding protein [Salmonella enterica]|nr:HU family DNA-binding protein [Salmonella enterica]EEK4464926.1 HU family DNA-binding protein [Salmonella enterica]
MTKHDLIVELADTHLIPRAKVSALLADLVNLQINDLLNTGETTLHGLGKLKVVKRAERLGRNPKTGVEITIPATKSLKFSVTKTLKESLNG